jgi:hypothetical protein
MGERKEPRTKAEEVRQIHIEGVTSLLDDKIQKNCRYIDYKCEAVCDNFFLGEDGIRQNSCKALEIKP